MVNVSHCIIEFFGTVLKRNWLKRDHLFYELDIKMTTLVYVMMKRPPKICIGVEIVVSKSKSEIFSKVGCFISST